MSTTTTPSAMQLFRVAKQTLTAATIRFKKADEALRNIGCTVQVRNDSVGFYGTNTPEVDAEWSAAWDARWDAEHAYHLAYDAAYPQPDVEATSAHVIVRKLGLANLLEADRIVKEQHAAGNLEFTLVFRGEAKRITDEENANCPVAFKAALVLRACGFVNDKQSATICLA